MHYLHTMLRVEDLEKALEFYCGTLGLEEVSRREDEKGRYTNVFLKAPDDPSTGSTNSPQASSGQARSSKEARAPLIELTYNWDKEKYAGGRNFGHIAFAVDDIYSYCKRLMEKGVVIARPPRDGRMAFIRSPEGISIELLQVGEPLEPQEPWKSMPSTGAW